MTVRTRGGKLYLAGGRMPTRESNIRAPTNADLGFVEAAFNATTDQAVGTYMFTATILNPGIFELQGYTFSNFRRTSGFAKLTGGTEGATSRPFTSNTMVIGDATLSTTCTISVDFAGPTSGTITAAIPGSIEAPPGTVVLHQFTLHNTSGSTLTPRARLGLAFEKGAFPGSFETRVREFGGSDVAFAALAGTNTWDDDSWRSTADGGLVMEDSNTIASSASRTYEVYAVVGTQPASSFSPWTWLAAHGNDLTVEITSRTGFTTGAMGDLTFSLQTAIATTTRREILCDTERFVRVKAWQKVSGEEHLICEFHLDFWLGSDGSTVKAIEFAAVLSQHWWIANPFGTTQTKERQTYTATVKYGSTTLDTRAGLAHAYYCRWASLRSDDDAQHARKHWINVDSSTPLPTVRVQYADSSLKTMMRAGYIPPLRLGVSYSSDVYSNPAAPSNGGMQNTYTPLGVNGHRAQINSTGGHVGRGIWGDPDAKLVVRQSQDAATAELAWRRCRVMAQAGLALSAHTRDHRSASGVNGGTDTTNRMIPHQYRKASALSLSESYSGLGTPCIYARNKIEGNITGLTSLGVDTNPTGGSGSFTGYDTAHSQNYSAPAAFLEGEAYLGDAALSLWNMSVTHLNFNQSGADAAPFYFNNATRQAAYSIPNATTDGYGVTADATQQERALAWCMNQLTWAYAVTSDARPERNLVSNHVKNFDAWLSKGFDYFPTAHRTKGLAFAAIAYQGHFSPWMCAWQGLAAYQMQRLAGEILPDNARSMTGFEEAAHLAARYVVRLADECPYALRPYHSVWFADDPTTALTPDSEFGTEYVCSLSSGTFTATPDSGTAWANGDKVRFMRNASFDAQTLPAGVTFGTLYYMVERSGNTFKVSATEGGAAIATGTLASVTAQIAPAAWGSVASIGAGGTVTPVDDHYNSMSMALVEAAIGNGHADMDNTIRDSYRTWVAAKVAGFYNHAAWNFDGDNLI